MVQDFMALPADLPTDDIAHAGANWCRTATGSAASASQLLFEAKLDAKHHFLSSLFVEAGSAAPVDLLSNFERYRKAELWEMALDFWDVSVQSDAA